MKYLLSILLSLSLTCSLFALTTEEENLFNAINEKNSQRVFSLMNSANVNINVLDTNGYTPIHRAIYNNDLNTVNELLKNTNLNINSKLDIKVNIDGWYLGGASPLILASYLGYTNIVKTLLDNNANIKAREDVDGSMAIHMASANGKNDVIEILLSKDETLINEKDNKGNTPLHWAAMKDKPETIKLLSEKGADLEAKDVDGWTPLHYASAFSSLRTVENLIELGADKESKANDGSVPLSYAQNEDIKTYLAGNENIEREDEEKTTAVDNELLEKEASKQDDVIIDTPKEDEGSADSKESEKDTDIESKELDVKQLELLVAIKNNDVIAINNLLKDGVNPNFQDEDGYSPLHRAIENNNLDCVNALLSYKDIDKEIKLPEEAQSSDGWHLGGATPLLLASYIGNPQIVSALVDANCNIRAKDDIDGAMAIHIAAGNGHNEVINILLKKDKTLINETDNNGKDTALHWAIMKDFPSTVELLLNNGANPNQKNSSGQTPLHYAALYENMDAAIILVEKYNADKDLKDEDGKTAADFADENEFREIASYLGGSTYAREEEDSSDLPTYKRKTDLSKKWWKFNR